MRATKKERMGIAKGLHSMLSKACWQARSYELLRNNSQLNDNYFIECCLHSLQRCFSIDITNFFTDTNDAVSVKYYLKMIEKGGIKKEDKEIHEEVKQIIEEDEKTLWLLEKIRGNRGAHMNAREFINSLNPVYTDVYALDLKKTPLELINWAERIYRIIEKHELGVEFPIEEDLERLDADYQKLQID